MKRLRARFLPLATGAAVLLTVSLALSQAANAQSYPSRPITIVVPFPRAAPQRLWRGSSPSK